TFAIDDSGAATNMLDFLRGLGVGVNERDVAVAFSQVFPRWLPLAPGTGTTQGTTETKPKSEDHRQKKRKATTENGRPVMGPSSSTSAIHRPANASAAGIPLLALSVKPRSNARGS